MAMSDFGQEVLEKIAESIVIKKYGEKSMMASRVRFIQNVENDGAYQI
jgi:hypothetical protein